MEFIKLSELEGHAVSYNALLKIIGTLLITILVITGGVGSYVFTQHMDGHASPVITEDRIDELKQAISDSESRLNKRIDETNERVKGVENRLTERIDRVENRIDERFNKMDERFDKMDERFNRMDERFDRIEKILADMKPG